jgi:hypothetical protein
MMQIEGQLWSIPPGMSIEHMHGALSFKAIFLWKVNQ